MTMVAKRSALRMWALAMAGIPLLVVSVDILTNRRITNWLREIIFRPEDTQIYEPRDVIWAWAMALFAGFLVIWGLKELFVPTKIVECRDEGLALKVRGPFRLPSVVPWGEIDDVLAIEVEDEGDRLPLLSLRVLSRQNLPDDPWGARWLGERELGLLAQDWSEPVSEVAEKIIDYAVVAAQKEARRRTARVWAEPQREEE